jgi:ankyrin repeat protein
MNNRRTFVATLGLGPVALVSGQTIANTSGPVTKSPTAAADIFEAAYRGDIARATELAKLNPAIARLKSADGRTPLHYAVEGGHADMVFFLTIQGADLSAGPESPLLAAVEYPDHDTAMGMSQALLMNASDPNALRADGRTALDLARARGYTDIAELLIHRGANADARNIERVYFGRRFSFDHNGRPYTPENLDGLPQDFINEFVRLSHADLDRVQHLLKLAPALAFGRATWDEMGIEAAAHMGLFVLADHLANYGAPVSTCTAALLGLEDRVRSLVQEDSGCVRERGAHDIGLIAYTALAEQRPAIADFLLGAGASVDARALGSVTTLHLAASKGYLELSEVLLKHGADVNAIGKPRGQEMTPLAMAIKAQQDKMADFLKSKGAR